VTRQDAIAYDFLEADRIWPPGIIASKRSQPFVRALVEVLTRLPDDAYYAVEEFVSFVVEDPRIAAVNVPFTRSCSLESSLTIRFDTIVIFHRALDLSHKALVGLVAHELAHSFVSHPDYKSDEQGADSQALYWGFDEELEALRVEMQKSPQKSSASS
jgi:hypothetical protein